MYSIEKNVIK